MSQLGTLAPMLFLGVGHVARAVRRRCPDRAAAGTTRRPPDARFEGITALDAADEGAVRTAARDAHVVVSFPPDPARASDARFAALVADASSVVYLSSTAVYSLAAGVVDETTPTTTEVREDARRRLQAEAVWSAAGASIVRLPAYYGPEVGLHRRLLAGTFKLPGDGTSFVSRVHLEDAASFVLAGLEAPRGTTLLAGDDEPARLVDVVTFLCGLLELPFPEREEDAARVSPTLRADRRVDSRGTRARFGLTLRHPTYREGFATIAQQGVASGR